MKSIIFVNEKEAEENVEGLQFLPFLARKKKHPVQSWNLLTM
jgi:hypothetical protein